MKKSSELSKFIRESTPEEKEAVFDKVIEDANTEQNEKMPCHITDDEPPKDYVEEDVTDERRQQETDDTLLETLADIARGLEKIK